MKKLFVLILLLGSSYFAYRSFWRAGPVNAYKKFADAWLRLDNDGALKFADGAAIKRTLERKSRADLLNPQLVEAYHGVSYTIEKTSEGESGEVIVEAKQVLSFDPPGITSAIGGAAVASFHHVATLKKTEDGWKVVSFEPTLIEWGTRRRR